MACGLQLVEICWFRKTFLFVGKIEREKHNKQSINQSIQISIECTWSWAFLCDEPKISSNFVRVSG